MDTFLIEPFVPHEKEYYVAINSARDSDVIFFSESGGIEVEEHWDSVQELTLPLEKNMEERLSILESSSSEKNVVDFLKKLYSFFVEYGFAYLEVNPFTFDSEGKIICLDMVARVDSCEAFRQKNNWKNLDFPASFGEQKTE